MTIIRQVGWLTLAAAVVLVAAAGPACALERFEFTEKVNFPHTSGPEIDVKSVAGDVTYRGIDGAKESTVEIIVEVRAADEKEAQDIREEIDINVDGTADYLGASVDWPRDFGRFLEHKFGKNREIAISFHITGPAGAHGSMSSVSGFARAESVAGPLKLSSVSGYVLADNVDGRVSVESVSGQVSATNCRGKVKAHSVSGDVRVSNCGGDLRAEAVSGDLAISDVAGSADLSSVSGDIDADAIGASLNAETTSGRIDVHHQSGDLELETTSGDIVARSEAREGRLDISSHSGSVRLYADVDQIGRIELSTYSGNLRVDPVLDGRDARRRIRRDGDLSLTLGDGRVTVVMDTHSGDIFVGEL